MNSQVIVDRELLQELADFCSDSRSYNEAIRVLATPAPIPDAGGEVLTPALRQYLHNDGSGLVAGYDLELTQRIVSALQASAMVVPDGYKLVPIMLTPEMITVDPYGMGYGRLHAVWSRLLAASPAAKGAKQ